MKDLDIILKYQELDIKLRKANDALEKSKSYENMEKARQDFSIAKKTRDDNEKTAENILSYVESAQKLSKEVNAMLDRLAKKDEITDDDIAQLEKAKAKLSEVEAKISERKGQSEKIIREFLDAGEQGKKHKTAFEDNKKEFMELKATKQPEINEITKELKALEEKISPEMFKIYKSITAERKFPAFVDAYVDKDSYYCRGCGIALSQAKTSEYKNNPYCICEKCKRVIYKKG